MMSRDDVQEGRWWSETYMVGRGVVGGDGDEDLFCVPVEEGSKVCVDGEGGLDKVLDVAVHVPGCLGADDLELVDAELARGRVARVGSEVDEEDEDEDDGGCERRDGVESRERAVHGQQGNRRRGRTARWWWVRIEPCTRKEATSQINSFVGSAAGQCSGARIARYPDADLADDCVDFLCQDRGGLTNSSPPMGRDCRGLAGAL